MKTKSKIFFFMAALFITMIFSVVSAFAAIDETEPNDTIYTANAISLGTMIYGQTDGYNGYREGNNANDFYKFIPKVSGTVKLIAWDDDIQEYGSDTATVKMEILNNNNEEIGSMYTNETSLASKSVTFGVVSGKTYYLKVQNGSDYESEMKDYRFKLVYYIGKTTIKSVKGKTKAFTVKWEKKRSTAFYQIQYTRKSTYDDYHWQKAKIVKISNKSNSKTIKKLAQKKKYYVRVRVARTIDGVTYYSGWSGKNVVKTK